MKIKLKKIRLSDRVILWLHSTCLVGNSGDGGICGYGETCVLESIRQLHGVFFFEGQKLGYGATFLFFTSSVHY